MPETLEQIVSRLKRAGQTAIQVHKYLRENNMGVPFILVRKIYLKS